MSQVNERTGACDEGGRMVKAACRQPIRMPPTREQPNKARHISFIRRKRRLHPPGRYLPRTSRRGRRRWPAGQHQATSYARHMPGALALP